jgi:ribosomal protein S18 acetylase RimI-like enzyme
VSDDPGTPGPRTTAGAPRTDLEALLQGLRKVLAVRDEDPSGSWVEESAAELARGVRTGWYVPGTPGGIAFFARRGRAAFGHLHTEGGPQAARSLAGILLRSLPPDVDSLDLGFTGLPIEEERSLVRELASAPGSTVIERRAMERAVHLADGRLAATPPPGVERVPIGAVTTEALVDLDRTSFRGSVDALLLGDEPGAYRDALEAMLGGRFGRFLPEASAALIEREPVRLVGAVLSAERSTQRAIVLDLVVDPERRRAGLGTYLLGWTLRAFSALGYESARLWVSERNAAALALYDRFGFRSTLEATIYRWDRAPSAPQPQTSR